MRQLLEKYKIKNKAERFSIDLQNVIQKKSRKSPGSRDQMIEWDREEEEEYMIDKWPWYHAG